MSAMIPIEKKKAEAIKRLKAFGIYKDAIQRFQKANLVLVSEPPYGALYWLDDDLQKIVKEFEDSHDALVYLVVRAYHEELGKMDSFLYVSDYEEEWDLDNNDVKQGYPMTYTYNYSEPMFSEFGSIGVIGRGGGLVRIA